jgi:hypothetical protein
MWLCPVSNNERSVWYAYRPKHGAIYYLDPIDLGQFKRAEIEGEPNAREALRGDPVGGMARSWSPAWFADRLLLPTVSGLLALEFLEQGKIRAQLVLSSPCIASPAVSQSEHLLMVLCEHDERTQIAALAKEEGGIALRHWLTWKDDVVPEVDPSMSVSLPSGVLDPEFHWIFANGVAVVESNEIARWYSAGDGIKLEPRVSPEVRGAEIKVFGWEGDHLKIYPLSGLKKESGEYSDTLLFPSGGADRNYWVANGDKVYYNRNEISQAEVAESIGKWPVSIWRLSSTLYREDTPVLLLGNFQKLSRPEILPASGGKIVTLGSVELHVGGETILEAQSMNFTQQIQMPLDALVFPISPETVIFYGGDRTPVTCTINLLGFRSKIRDGGIDL